MLHDVTLMCFLLYVFDLLRVGLRSWAMEILVWDQLLQSYGVGKLGDGFGCLRWTS